MLLQTCGVTAASDHRLAGLGGKARERQQAGGGGGRRRSPQVYQLICLLLGPAAGTKGTLRSTRLLYSISWAAGVPPLQGDPHGCCQTRSIACDQLPNTLWDVAKPEGRERGGRGARRQAI